MAHDGQDMTMMRTPLLNDLLAQTAASLPAVDVLLDQAKANIRALVTKDGRISAPALR